MAEETSGRMPDNMSDRTPDGILEDMPEKEACQNERRSEHQKECQKRMPKIMPRLGWKKHEERERERG